MKDADDLTLITNGFLDMVVQKWREKPTMTIDTDYLVPVPEDALRALIDERDELLAELARVRTLLDEARALNRSPYLAPVKPPDPTQAN